ncbi:hypothetical protein MRY82_02470 [bacterium]|nr:hypothetical protein [bacterium]
MSLKTLPGYYIQNPVTRIYYKIILRINSKEVAIEKLPDLLEYLQQHFMNNPNYELKQDQEKKLNIIPLPTQ